MKPAKIGIFGRRGVRVVAFSFRFVLAGCKGGLFGGGGGGGGKNINPPVTGLTATAGNGEVTLSWNPYPGATSYNVARGTTSGGACPAGCNYVDTSNSTTSYTDPGLTNGTTFYYQVNANYSAGFSGLSNQASATPSGPSTNVSVTVDWLSNEHGISPNIYGGAFPKDASTITDVFLNKVVRWGGNASSTYNWKLGAYNAGGDNFFEDFTFCGLGGPVTSSPCTDSDSVQFINDVKAAFGFPIMTMPMLNWVAQSPETNGNGHWSFSVARDGSQCHTDSQNSDAGDGIALTATCDTQPTFLTASSTDINAAYVPLLDDHSQACNSGNCMYRSDWTAALASAFGSNNNFFQQHFYEMDNEMDMWGVTHRDIHPSPSAYDEMANVYVTEATKLKGWDPQAVRFGPVSCCWQLYWNGANSNDKAAHAGVDFLPWWLNEIYWQDQISGARSLDVFDIHAFPDATTTDTSGNPLPKSQLQALATSIFRDYWDPGFVSPSATINQNVTSVQPNRTIPFRIPRMRALVNAIYPGTPLAITEWSASFAGESDFSTALADADAYGIMGLENVYLASRWTAPNPANPNYWALRLYTNYDGNHNGFGSGSISASNNGDPNLFSSYATGFLYFPNGVASGSSLAIMIINKDPQNSVQAQFTLKNFNASSFTRSTLIPASPTTILSSTSQPWSPAQSFSPYSITLLVISGIPATVPNAIWVLNPDTIMVPAGGTGHLNAAIAGGYGNGIGTVTLNSAVFDVYEGAPACSGNIVLTNAAMTSTQPGTLTVIAGNTPGFCHFTVTGTDSAGVAKTEGGWIVVGNPPASLTISGGNNQTGAKGTTLPVALAVTLAPGSSGGANPAAGASIFFTTNTGILSNGTASGSKVIATTNSSGVASVTLTLPSTAQTVTVNAEGPYGLGHPIVTFTETSQ